MRIGLLMDGLEWGGAQTQLAQLALGLQQRGHEVEVMAYTAGGPVGEELQRRGVLVRSPRAGSKWAKLAVVREWLRTFRPEVLHGWKMRVSNLAVLANLLERRCPVVGMDFSIASYSRHSPDLWAALLLYTFVDAVVTESEMNRRNLARLAPWLVRRLRVIRNGVDIERFQPMEGPAEKQGAGGGGVYTTTEAGREAGSILSAGQGPAPQSIGYGAAVSAAEQKVFRFVCVGTVYRVKNPVRVVEAVRRLYQRKPGRFRLDWYGSTGPNPAEPFPEYTRAIRLVHQYGLHDWLCFHAPRADIEQVYREGDALVHVSLREGIPNAVVEGMACGLPVVVSRVSDLPLIVQEGRNGFVCDETKVEAIADAMHRMLETPAAVRAAMGRRSRELAVRWFGMDRFINDYEALYRSLLAT